jgi:hypothetical protein
MQSETNCIYKNHEPEYKVSEIGYYIIYNQGDILECKDREEHVIRSAEDQCHVCGLWVRGLNYAK